MRRLGKILFGAITAAMISGTVLSSNSSICQAAGENPAVDENLTFGEVYNTAVEAAYGDTFRSVYENRLAGSPLEVEEIDGVDTATGHLIPAMTCYWMGQAAWILNSTDTMTATKPT